MGNFGGNRFGGRSRDRDGDRSGDRFGSRNRGSRFSGRDSRRPSTMHDATCDKCGMRCQVPFRPSGDKPVLCSDCFRKNDGSNTGNFSSRNQGSSSSGATSEQLNQINKKLDKILSVLKELEIETDDEDSGKEFDDNEDEAEDLDSEEEFDDNEDEEEDLEAEEEESNEEGLDK